MSDIAIYGAGGFGREVKMLIDQINEVEDKFNFVGYFDDGIEKDKDINGYPVLGNINDLNNFEGKLGIVFSLADPKLKKKILSKIQKEDVSFPTLIHPSCYIGTDNVKIGEGCIICAFTLISVDISIGKHVILNLNCTVGHDTDIGDFSSIMPAVNISGEIEMGECVYCGTGAKLVNQLKIGSFSKIGAGSIVFKEVKENTTVIGNPGRVISKN
jgi:sugar O-acyltransferase (sialic acid O-acetyltransferase NeuD family)